MPRTLYSTSDANRFHDESTYRPINPYRSDYRRDLDRLIHSTCFRRLQGKTQLYPGLESDFFRNRLTHSLEVAQIAQSIAAKINVEHREKFGDDLISLDIVEFAGLAHDLGHPPFGHQGEEMLNLLMKDQGGYEGNAQTLRILRRIEKKGFDSPMPPFDARGQDQRMGLNLTARSLASILKYDKSIPSTQSFQEGEVLHAKKGYYGFDEDTVQWIKHAVGGHRQGTKFKTIECQIMDLADDIAYSTYDLEDGLKAGFYTLMDVVFCSAKLRHAIAHEVEIKFRDTAPYKIKENDVATILQDLFQPFSYIGEADVSATQSIRNQHLIITNLYYEGMLEYSMDGYARNFLSSSLVNHFMEGIEFEFDEEYPTQSKVFLKEKILKEVEVLKKFTFTSQVLSSRLKIAEVRGQEIVNQIFDSLTTKNKKGFELLPADYRTLYDSATTDNRRRIICDFVAGMTDRYAIEFYGRLKSENPETIFKPL